MKKIEAPTLEEAYQKAAEHFGCSVTQLQCEIVQYPSSGLLGLFKKPAIIVADIRQDALGASASFDATEPETSQSLPEVVAQEVMSHIENEEETSPKAHTDPSYTSDAIVEDFFKNDTPKADGDLGDEADIARLIEDEIRRLMDVSCFDIDVVEVDVADNTALIFIDGEDAALLIGKEGYRYNALSYMLFNWINDKYDLYIKLEIAQFYTSQQEMMRHMLQPLIEEIRQNGRGRTRFLDGILVQIALEQLREAFPDKYVAIKKSKDGQRFVVVNDFYPRTHA